MKVATILLAGAVLTSPGRAQAQTATGSGVAKPAQTDTIRVPRGSVATSARTARDTDRVIDDELKRIDHMTAICTGC